ncbi:protein C2-DOMAIN ABA-RELATED 2-like isoform X2 [Solanum tuberosum]|uniref:protein C2-DOMAIN ABA-RELATED 2-like isoform X2 n=1 Tax=Solanum tuberosum TaxID=4113 RepID=UPI0003D279FA|nr:PREDICTED: protein C2-DOMAIN ABA-RELATED 2-like isoform X2 [Solanum tuberosum]
MENQLGLLRVRIIRGINLAIRDLRSSDPYVVVTMGKQQVYDKDTFSYDDKMGDAELDVVPFIDAVRMTRFKNIPNGVILSRIMPNRQNCYSEESCIVYENGKVVQNVFLRLRNVECGEIQLQLQWIDVPS